MVNYDGQESLLSEWHISKLKSSSLNNLVRMLINKLVVFLAPWPSYSSWGLYQIFKLGIKISQSICWRWMWKLPIQNLRPLHPIFLKILDGLNQVTSMHLRGDREEEALQTWISLLTYERQGISGVYTQATQSSIHHAFCILRDLPHLAASVHHEACELSCLMGIHHPVLDNGFCEGLEDIGTVVSLQYTEETGEIICEMKSLGIKYCCWQEVVQIIPCFSHFR